MYCFFKYLSDVSFRDKYTKYILIKFSSEKILLTKNSMFYRPYLAPRMETKASLGIFFPS
jgi:hypothetical protein